MGARTTHRTAEAPRQLDMAGLDSILGFAVSLVRQCLYREFAERFARLRITPNLYSILLLVAANPGCRQLEIGAALGILQTNLVKRIDVLLERELIARTVNSRDRRARALHLTPKGRRLVRSMHATHAALTRDLVGRIGEKNHQQLLVLLAKTAQACRQPRSARRPALDED
jgi:DNA-binding MarR family transcriptional regulator